MKLLMCPACGDVFNLKSEVKTCGCGQTRGQYTDERNAVYDGGVPLGFANSTFLEAVLKQPKEGLGKTFTAFVIPQECPTFKQVAVTGAKPLVNFLSEVAPMSTSMARRRVVQGAVKVNGEVVDDPAARLTRDEGQLLLIEYNGVVYTYSPEVPV